MPTLRDIAAEAGVSVTTVSVVLDGKANERRISEPTRLRVVEAASRLGFRPNVHARALRTGRTNQVGVIGLNLDSAIPRAAAQHVSMQLVAHGYSAIPYDFSWQADDCGDPFAYLDSRHVAGFIITTSQGGRLREFIERCIERRVPIVAVDDWDIPGVDVVTVDREEGGYLATAHLISLDHRRIALTAPPDVRGLTMQARVLGYRRAHAEAGIPVDESLMFGGSDCLPPVEIGMDAAKRLLSHPLRPTAVFCTNDQVAMGVIRGFYEAGKRVPDDMAVVGFDDVESSCSAVPLTTIAQPVGKVVEIAVSILTERLNNPEATYTPKRITVTPELIIRHSCGARR